MSQSFNTILWCQELQLWCSWGSVEGGPPEPPRIHWAECNPSLPSCCVEVDHPIKEGPALSPWCLCWELEAYQEWHPCQAGHRVWVHHEPPLRWPHLRERWHRSHEQHHLSLPLLPGPVGSGSGGSRPPWIAELCWTRSVQPSWFSFDSSLLLSLFVSRVL